MSIFQVRVLTLRDMTFNYKRTRRTVRIPDYAMALTKKRLSIWFISSAEFVREHRIQKKTKVFVTKAFLYSGLHKARVVTIHHKVQPSVP